MSASVISPTQFGSHARARVLEEIHEGMARRLGRSPEEEGPLRESLTRNEHAWNESMGVSVPEFVEQIH